MRIEDLLKLTEELRRLEGEIRRAQEKASRKLLFIRAWRLAGKAFKEEGDKGDKNEG